MGENKSTTNEQENNGEYPSAKFLYSVSLEDYNRILSNYDKIYERINIALAISGVILMVVLNNIDLTVLFTNPEIIVVVVYYILAIGSTVLIVAAVIKLLLLSRSKVLLSFDSNSIKGESLYEEKEEHAALWVTLQHIRVINDIRDKIKEKQKAYDSSIMMVIIALLAYVVSMLIRKGGAF